MAKKSQGHGYNYFQKLPDELVILIFTKLSTATGNNTLEEDIKSLVQCSTVSKRFNALGSLVPTLSISHPSVKLLNKYCSKILNKFKHIRSLHVNSTTKTELYGGLKDKPFVLWDAVYEPHNYCLAVVSCTRFAEYSNLQQKSSLMHSHVCKYDRKLNESSGDVAYFIHMLVSSIKDHKMLKRVVIANVLNPQLGNLILEEDTLAKLKNCTHTSRKQVKTHKNGYVCTTTKTVKTREDNRNGYVDKLVIPLNQSSGYVMSNVYYNIMEWWGRDLENHDYQSIPKALDYKGSKGILLKKVLERLLSLRHERES